MRYQLQSLNDLLILKLCGDVTGESWRTTFSAAEASYQATEHAGLLVDGSNLKTFDVSHVECQRLARGFVEFAKRGAFYSNDPLIFGMMRVIHSYSNNDLFTVCKTCEQAMDFLRDCSQDYA